MDIEEIQDGRDRKDRVGKRPFPLARTKESRRKVKIFLVFLVVILTGYVFTREWQTYLKSFATTTKDVRARHFQKLDNVPEWHIVITNN